jgi:hypothetical protein
MRPDPCSCTVAAGGTQTCQCPLAVVQALDAEGANAPLVFFVTVPSMGLVANASLAVSGVNEAPFSVSLSGTTLPANAEPGFVVGLVTAQNPELRTAPGGEALSFSLVDASGLFSVRELAAGMAVVFTGPRDSLQDGAQLSLRVQCAEAATPSLSAATSYLLRVTRGNTAPSDVSPSTVQIDGSQVALVGTVVTAFSVSDAGEFCKGWEVRVE